MPSESPHARSHCRGTHDQHHHIKKGRRRSFWASLVPVVACLFCPACLSVWLPMLGSTGLILGFNESRHAWVMAIAIGIAMTSAVYRFIKDRDKVVLAVTILGCVWMGLGEALGDITWMVALGGACLLSLAVRSVYLELKHGH